MERYERRSLDVILTKARFWQSIAGIPINTQVGITSSPEQACMYIGHREEEFDGTLHGAQFHGLAQGGKRRP